ncbi:hypothetical protein BC940DRAFT_298237 [Gongronella butleri]|nr:hypothetical protein BC940DRAFT_298237 [Gongronella butleri]
MPPRYLSAQQSTQRPLQNEIIALNKLLTTDILEYASRILDNFAVTHASKAGIESPEPPRYLIDKLLEKCDNFDTVCDQVFYQLEQSKHALEMQLIQTKVASEKKKLEDAQQQQQAQAQGQDIKPAVDDTNAEDDLALGISNDQQDDSMMIIDTDDAVAMDVDMDAGSKLPVDEEEMEEMLNIQKDRLARLKKVMVLGLDATQVNADSGKGTNDDLLF